MTLSPDANMPDNVQQLLEQAYKERVSDLDKSISLANEALEISNLARDTRLMGKCMNHLALFHMIRGEYAESTRMSEKAISYFEALNDEKGIADARYNIAGVYYKTDNFHLGLVYLIDAIRIYQKFDDFHNISRSEKSLGTIYEYFGDQNNAVRSYENAIGAAKKVKDLNLESNAYNNLSGVLLKQGRIKEAMALIEKSAAIKGLTGDLRGSAFAIYGRGKVYTVQGDYQKAEADFLEAIDIHQQMGERLGLGMAYNKLANLYVNMGLLDKGKAVAETGLEFSRQYNIVIAKFKCHYLLYRIYKEENNAVAALQCLERYLSQKEAVINTQTLKVIENYELITQMKTLEKEAQLQKEKAEIIEKKNRAEESARVRQEFLSTMSHEIRTPLNAVLTIVALLKDRSDQEEKQLLETLRFASNNLLRIINDILDFTKLDSGKTTLELRKTRFKPLLEQIWRTYENMASQKDIKLALKMDVALSEYYDLDETKFSQIIGNLIDNAIKFTDEGSVIIEAERCGGDSVHDMIRFRVSDTGEGIAQDFLEEIFESFSQTKPVTTRKQGGTGLGLAIVKKLVQLHGSDIQVESELGKGSVFVFDLKLQKTKMDESPTDTFSNLLKDKVALLAEDNDINAFVIRKLLSKWGVITEHAGNGKDAIAKAELKHYDFILMDIHMPEVNGFDATAYIRQHPNLNKETPIFALTADITAPHNEEYFDFFTGFLWKPLQIEKLFEVLAESVSKAE